jgi:hypothetical protein
VITSAAFGSATALAAQTRSVTDSLLRARVDSAARADSVVGTLPAAEIPVLTETGMSHRWNRDSLFSTGLLTVADVLDRVPGLATLRARFYLAPQVGSYNGDVARVRLFLDGVELEPLDPRSGGVTDLSLFPIASLDELVVERAANELRVLMRSWRGPQRATAQTRADVYTGDNRSNTFRGFLARRAHNGFAFQTMLQQRSTEDRRLGGDGDATSVFVRAGVIRARWSLDATLLRVRSAQQILEVLNTPTFTALGRAIPRYDLVNSDAYLRFATGDMSRGAWLQVIAASRSSKENSPARSASSSDGFAADSADTSATSAQYVLTGGWTSPRARLSVTERLRRVNGETLHQPSIRAGVDLGRLTANAFAERNPFDEVTRADAMVRFAPVSAFAISGAASYGTAGSVVLTTDSLGARGNVVIPVAKAARAEVAFRLGKIWLQAGGVVRGGTLLRAPRIFDRTLPNLTEGRITGATFGASGPLLRGLMLNVNGTRWSNAGFYRPQLQVRSELAWRYHWTGAYAKGGFDFMLAGETEYRTKAFFPFALSNGRINTLTTFAATPIALRAELAIQDATISVQIRNTQNAPYTTVPGLLMPGPLTIYGVRWTFWN